MTENYSGFLNDYGSNPAQFMPVHESPCDHCPSMQGPDPETNDLLKIPKEIRMLAVFPCAWRNEKVCFGIHKNLSEAP